MGASEKTSALEKVRALREEADKLMEEAKAEALEKAEKAIADLNSLGLTYRLSEGEELHAHGHAKRVTRKKLDKACPVCKFKTEPLHDGRLHRSQKVKKPFTDAELKERSLVKVE